MKGGEQLVMQTLLSAIDSNSVSKGLLLHLAPVVRATVPGVPSAAILFRA
jgi:hypothetical protein